MITAAKIKRFRKKMGWTRTELAAKVGVSEQAVWYWEKGTRSPSGPAQRLLEQIVNGTRGER